VLQVQVLQVQVLQVQVLQVQVLQVQVLQVGSDPITQTGTTYMNLWRHCLLLSQWLR
jgi:hypothetical protein